MAEGTEKINLKNISRADLFWNLSEKRTIVKPRKA